MLEEFAQLPIDVMFRKSVHVCNTDTYVRVNTYSTAVPHEHYMLLIQTASLDWAISPMCMVASSAV